MTLGQLMQESNWIEGDRTPSGKGKLFSDDLEAAQEFLDGPINERTLFQLHARLAACRPYAKSYKDLWGKWRDCDVWIGGKKAPSPEEVPKMMRLWLAVHHDKTAWQAHNEFEWAHPFVDLNGRTGRLIWLHRMGGQSKLPFLQAYYYQTLSNVNL